MLHPHQPRLFPDSLRNSFIMCLVGMFSSACIADAHGARASSNQQTYIEELTVLGGRDKETLRDESHSVAMFDREALDFATQHTFSELFERVPNATTNAQNEPVIRGIAQFGIDNGPRLLSEV